MKNFHSFSGFTALVFLFVPFSLLAQEQEPLNLSLEAQKAWDARTVVPQTDDIKELRAFLQYKHDNWMEMNDHLRGEQIWKRFRIEENKANFEAANRILALAKDEPQAEKEPGTKSRDEYMLFGSDVSDTDFALREKMGAFHDLKSYDSTWEQQYAAFVEELEQNPARKDVAFMAKARWFNLSFNSSLFSGFDVYRINPNLQKYLDTFEKLKDFVNQNENHPYLKHHIDDLYSTQIQCAELQEGGSDGKIKKGTLVKPALEYYRGLLIKYDDAYDAQGWVRNIDRELEKYEILTADDPLAAFQAKVGELKVSLEAELNDELLEKVFGYYQVAEELECRKDVLLLLLTTVRPIFAASEDEKIRDYVFGFDISLKHLALEGVEFEFEAILMDGTKIDIKDYRGKVVILDYWATWCGPCLGEMPTMKTFYKNWHEDRSVEVIGFSVDEDLDAWKQYVENENLAWPNASEVLSKEKNLPDSRERYQINAYPTTILIDQNGKVVRAGNGLYSVIMEVGKLFPRKPEEE